MAGEYIQIDLLFNNDYFYYIIDILNRNKKRNVFSNIIE